MQTKTIIIVDDEPTIRHLVKTFLARHHFTLYEADSAAALMTLLQTVKPDLIILDLMLPDRYGLDVCKDIRKDSHVPIIMLTAVEGEMSTVLGFEAGADDYIQKPFSAQVLLSRIQAILRRSTTDALSIKADTGAQHYKKAFFSQWTYLPEEACLKSNTGKLTFLTKNECQLLHLFLTHEQTIFSREHIAEELKLDIDEATSRAIDVQISRLRNKLKDKSQNNLIKSIRNKGYLFTVPVRIVT